MAADQRAPGIQGRYPQGWEEHLLKTYPANPAPVGDRSVAGKVAQIHSMQRDEQGRFNDLAAGIPDWTPAMYRAMDFAVRDMHAAGRVANVTPPPPPPAVTTINPFAIEAAILQLKADAATSALFARIYEVLRYFQSPPGLRRFDAEGFACQLVPPTDARGLYRLKRQACYAVWERLPLAERLKGQATG